MKRASLPARPSTWTVARRSWTQCSRSTYSGDNRNPSIMDASGRKRWVSRAILLGVAYFVVGLAFAELAKPTVSDQARFWRLAAWVVSAIIYGGHIVYEQLRLRNSIRATALHAAMAVGLGAFLLAVGATVHKVVVTSHTSYWRFALALVVWPIITSVPAFLVAIAVAALLARLPTKL